MKPYQRALAYLTVAAGLGGAGCEKDPSPLEQQVQASEAGLKVAPGTAVHGRLTSSKVGEELDLRSPENPVKHFRSYIQNVEFPITRDQFLECIKPVSTEKFYSRNEKAWREDPAKEDLDRAKKTHWRVDKVEYLDEKKAKVRIVYDFPEGRTEGEQFTVLLIGNKWLIDKD